MTLQIVASYGATGRRIIGVPRCRDGASGSSFSFDWVCFVICASTLRLGEADAVLARVRVYPLCLRAAAATINGFTYTGVPSNRN